MVYNPDTWELVWVKGDTPHWRVFGSWSGGYLDGDSWRLNSGITKVEESDTHYRFIGESGSVYECHKDAYGVRSPYNSSILAQIIANGMGETFDEMPNISELF